METEREHKTGLSRHGPIILLCCLIPLAILGVLWAIGVSIFYLIFGVAMLLILLMHVLPMVLPPKHRV